MKILAVVLLVLLWSWAGAILGVEVLPEHPVYELLMIYTVVIGDAAIVITAFRKELGLR